MVKAGYKQTAVGVIPEDWDALPLGSSTEFKNGLNKAKIFFGHGTPIVNYMDVFKHSGLHQRDIAGLVSVTTDEQNAYSARKGDVFFTRTSETVDEIGVSAVLLEDVEKAVFSGFILRGRDKAGAEGFHLGFKKYCFSSEPVRKQIRSSASYTTRALTNGNLLAKVLVPTPRDTEEQKSIAGALSDVDGLIAGLEALIAKKRSLKTAAMQQLLTGKTRLPGFGEGIGMKQTELGEIPEDWAVLSVDECSTKVGSGITPKGGSNVYKTTGRPFIRSQNVGWGTARGDELALIDEATHQSFPATEIHKDDVLLNITGASIGRCCVAEEVFVGGNVNQHVCIIRSNENLNAVFLALQILSDLGQRQIDSFQAGGNREGLNFKQVRSIQFPVPSDMLEQKEIAGIAQDLSFNLGFIENQLAKTKALKQGMMQELLTGHTRLI